MTARQMRKAALSALLIAACTGGPESAIRARGGRDPITCIEEVPAPPKQYRYFMISCRDANGNTWVCVPGTGGNDTNCMPISAALRAWQLIPPSSSSPEAEAPSIQDGGVR